MWRVVEAFADITDSLYKYSVGDEYPRAGVKASYSRIKELSTSRNRRGIPLIEEVKPDSPEREE